MSVQSVSPQELQAIFRSGREVDLIDVRTPVEFREVHVSFAHNVPLETLNPLAIQATRARSTDPLYVICKSGSRGKQACEKLLASGIAQVINVEGGTMACEQAGLDVVRGKKAISLERQVRIAAGLLVLTGALLSLLVDQRWVGLSAFVGAGLVFAGVTDTCGMGLILARMPWNQLPKTTVGANNQHCAKPSSGSCCQ
jgi:rhodanese-related sulfurtransferase